MARYPVLDNLKAGGVRYAPGTDRAVVELDEATAAPLLVLRIIGAALPEPEHFVKAEAAGTADGERSPDVAQGHSEPTGPELAGPAAEPEIPHPPERPEEIPGEAAESAAASAGPSDFNGTPPPAELGEASAQEQKQQPKPEPAPPAGGATPKRRKPK
jgi:hypothetical protein